MQLGFFSRSSFELLLEVVDKDDETACSASGRSNSRAGLVAGWPKTSRRGKRAATLSSSKTGETWQWQHRGRVSLFIPQRKNNCHPNRLIRRLPHGAR
jgi:hypothetical protein